MFPNVHYFASNIFPLTTFLFEYFTYSWFDKWPADTKQQHTTPHTSAIRWGIIRYWHLFIKICIARNAPTPTHTQSHALLDSSHTFQIYGPSTHSNAHLVKEKPCETTKNVALLKFAVMNNYQAAAAAAQGYGPPASPHTTTRGGFPGTNSPGPTIDMYSSSAGDSVGYVQAASPQPSGFPAIAVSRAPLNYSPVSRKTITQCAAKCSLYLHSAVQELVLIDILLFFSSALFLVTGTAYSSRIHQWLPLNSIQFGILNVVRRSLECGWLGVEKVSELRIIAN